MKKIAVQIDLKTLGKHQEEISGIGRTFTTKQKVYYDSSKNSIARG